MEVLSTVPANNAEGISLASTITVVFDEVIDVDSIKDGQLVVVTSATKVMPQGPALEDLSMDNSNLLTSSVFSGFVEGTISTTDGLTFVFTPSSPLEPNKTYKIIAGTGILSKTINAVVPNGGNTSTGSFTVKGPYTGDIDDTFTIAISTGGALGTARFRWTRTSDNVTSAPVVTDRLVELEDGVYLKFTPGNYVLNDTFTFTVVEGEPLDEIYTASFVTGAPSYVEVSPDTPSVEIWKHEVGGITRVDSAASTDSGTLAVVDISPYHQQSNVWSGLGEIVITFNKAIDADSITTAVLDVIMENLPMDETMQQSVKLPVTASVSGNKLTLRFTG